VSRKQRQNQPCLESMTDMYACLTEKSIGIYGGSVTFQSVSCVNQAEASGELQRSYTRMDFATEGVWTCPSEPIELKDTVLT
jgi:hypothetical protein